MPLFGNYEQSGVGIAKDAPQKKPFFRFWELFGRKFWKLLELNVLMMVCCIPLVISFVVLMTMAETHTSLVLGVMAVMGVIFAVLFGPWLASATQVLRKFVLEKPCFMIQTFFRTFKSSFKQALPLGLINILVMISVTTGFYIYPRFIQTIQEAGGSTVFYYAMFVATISIALVITLMSFYGYLMIVSTDLSFKNVLKNSLALSFIALKKNALTLVLVALIMVVFAVLTFYFPYFMMFIFIFMPVSFLGFLIVFNTYPVIQKYVINPYYVQRGEINPELTHNQTDGEN
ncbi:MAG: hypothetical protein K2I93_02945, partial [Oscillospiraceae bacterium]|nr:hypothetical protein [Oscillospiraceae bacterium]